MPDQTQQQNQWKQETDEDLNSRRREREEEQNNQNNQKKKNDSHENTVKGKISKVKKKWDLIIAIARIIVSYALDFWAWLNLLKDKENRKWLYILIIVIIFLVIGGFIALIFFLLHLACQDWRAGIASWLYSLLGGEAGNICSFL